MPPVERTCLSLVQGITDFSKRVHVKDLFEKFGELHACWLPPVGRRCGGEFGYIKFKRESSAEEACTACNRGLVDLWGVKLGVEWRMTPTNDVQHDHDFDAKGSNLLSSRDLYRQQLMSGRAKARKPRSSSSSSSGKRKRKRDRRDERDKRGRGRDDRGGGRQSLADNPNPSVRDIENMRDGGPARALEDQRGGRRDDPPPRRDDDRGYDRDPRGRQDDRDPPRRDDDRGRPPARDERDSYDRREPDRREPERLPPRSRSPARRPRSPLPPRNDDRDRRSPLPPRNDDRDRGYPEDRERRRPDDDRDRPNPPKEDRRPEREDSPPPAGGQSFILA